MGYSFASSGLCDCDFKYVGLLSGVSYLWHRTTGVWGNGRVQSEKMETCYRLINQLNSFGTCAVVRLLLCPSSWRIVTCLIEMYEWTGQMPRTRGIRSDLRLTSNCWKWAYASHGKNESFVLSRVSTSLVVCQNNFSNSTLIFLVSFSQISTIDIASFLHLRHKSIFPPKNIEIITVGNRLIKAYITSIHSKYVITESDFVLQLQSDCICKGQLDGK